MRYGMAIVCKNYDFKFIMNFLAVWFGGMKLAEIPRDELAGVIEKFFGG